MWPKTKNDCAAESQQQIMMLHRTAIRSWQEAVSDYRSTNQRGQKQQKQSPLLETATMQHVAKLFTVISNCGYLEIM
jgi:hypothetical protein